MNSSEIEPDFTNVVRGDEYYTKCTLCRIDKLVGYQLVERHLGLFAAVQAINDDDHARSLPGEGVQA